MVDILTKAIGRTKFVYFREKIVMIENMFQWQKRIVQGVAVQQLAVVVLWATWYNILRGSCITNVVVTMVVSWEIVHVAVVQWMRGSMLSINNVED